MILGRGAREKMGGGFLSVSDVYAEACYQDQS